MASHAHASHSKDAEKIVSLEVENAGLRQQLTAALAKIAAFDDAPSAKPPPDLSDLTAQIDQQAAVIAQQSDQISQLQKRVDEMRIGGSGIR